MKISVKCAILLKKKIMLSWTKKHKIRVSVHCKIRKLSILPLKCTFWVMILLPEYIPCL